MTTEYVKNLNRSYLILREMGKDFSSYEMQMAMRGEIPSFLPFDRVMADGNAEYWYDITGKQPFEVVMECKKADMRFLTRFVGSLVTAGQSLEAFLLDERCVSFSPECMFYHTQKKEYQFCYIPGYDRDNRAELQTLMEMILRHLDHADERAVAAGYALYQKVAEGNYCVSDLMQCLGGESICEIRSEEQWEAEEEPSLEIPGDTVEKNAPLWKLLWKKLRRVEKKEVEKNGDEWENADRGTAEKPGFHTGAFWGTGEQKTVFLSEPSDEIQGQLLYQGKNGQDHLLVDVGKDNYFIGSNIETVDGYIKNESVSRIHARIFKLRDEYYVEDLNSTNGTTLNGEPIVYSQKEKLNKNDRLVFATEEYLFC